MDPSLLEAIAGRLEAGKTAGWLSDYLVAWHGPSENLAPEVTVWRSVERAGRRADVVVLSARPFDDIRNRRQPEAGHRARPSSCADGAAFTLGVHVSGAARHAADHLRDAPVPPLRPR